MNAQRDDLLARIRGMHALWQRGVADLTVEHANHVERPGVLPIAFTLMHFVGGEDHETGSLLDAGAPLWGAHAPRFGVAVPRPGRGTPMEVASALRITDMTAWREYQSAVFARTERTLATLADDRWDALLWDGRRPVELEGGFLGAYVREGPIRRRNAIEAWIFQHGARHLGELEHARALVGLGGLS